MPEIKGGGWEEKVPCSGTSFNAGQFYPRLTMTGTLSTVYSDQRSQFQPDGTTGETGYWYIQGSPSSLVVEAIGKWYLLPAWIQWSVSK